MAKQLKTVVREILLSAVAKEQGVKALQAKVEAARDGMYTTGCKAAAAAKSQDVFVQVIETLEDDFKANRRGLAERFEMPQQKTSGKNPKPKTDADGNPVYCIPGSLRTMKSVVLRGFRYKVDFGTPDNPTPFSVVRAACDAAAEAEAKAARTPDDEARDVIREVLAKVSKSLDDIEGKKALTAALKLTQELAAAMEKAAA